MKSLFILLNLLIIISSTYSNQSFYQKNACTDRTPDRKLKELSQVFADFKCNREKYGIGRIIDCNFSHELPEADEEGVEHFLCTVLVKDAPKQNSSVGVGEFIQWSDSAVPVKCKPNIITAIINKDNKTKDKITFSWKSPTKDLGQLYIAMAYSGSQYLTEIRKYLRFTDYPVSLKECGKEESCMRYSSSSKDCDATCNYAITYGFSDSYHNTVKFTFDINKDDENAFLAIAFTKNVPDTNNMNGTNVFACVRNSDRINAESYVFDEKNMLITNKMKETFQNFDEEHDKYYFGCKFQMPVKVPGKNHLDLNETLYRMYFWGKLDKGIPVLPAKPWSRSEEAHSLEMQVDDRFPQSGSTSGQNNNFFLLLCTFVLCLIYF